MTIPPRLPLSRIPVVEMFVIKARPGVADGELGPKMALRPNFQRGSSHFGHSLSPEKCCGKKKTTTTVNPKQIQPPTSPTSLFPNDDSSHLFSFLSLPQCARKRLCLVITHRVHAAHIRYSHRFMHSQINPTVTARAASLFH